MKRTSRIIDVNQRIDDLRIAHGWSKHRLALEIGISDTAVYDWFNEKHAKPSNFAIENVCTAFDMTLAEFYAGIDSDGEHDPREVLLLDYFRHTPEAKRETVLALVKAFAEQEPK